MDNKTSGFHRSALLTRRGITGAWLLLFYVFSIWMVLGTLSSHQFQEKIRQENLSGARVSVVAVRQLLELREQITGMETLLRAGETMNRKIRNDRDLINARIAEMDAITDNYSQQVSFGLKADGVDAPPYQVSQLPDEMKVRISEKENLKGAYEEYLKKVGERSELEKKYRELTLTLEQNKSANLETRSRLESVTQQQDGILSRHEGLHNHLNDLVYMRKIRVDFLATMPAQMLTLILTLSMGALGSVIYLTRTFFDESLDRPFNWFLFRPFLGMVTAIAIFILAKAGQIIISDTSIQDNLTNNLNPFFISFLAIISGLLSEQAYEKIQRSGYTFFGVETEEERRWAFRLKHEIESQDKDPGEITELLEVSPKLIRDWMEEKYPVPAREQELIAVWLNRSVRELFTSQPPREGREMEEEEKRED